MSEDPTCCGRREVLYGSGVLLVGAALAGCSSAADRAEVAASDNAAASTAREQAAVSPVAGTGDIPVGGGVVVPARQLVITQPTEGQFRAFSSICTHQGCPVTAVQDGAIICPCHGSRFDIDTGAAVVGPAEEPLSARSITVEGEDLFVA